MPRRTPRARTDAALSPALLAPRGGARPAVSASERARIRLVRVVLVIYLLAIFEGSIRKYLVPQFGQYVFFIRDPFLIYAYVLATRHALWPRDNALFAASIGMCVLGLLLFTLQVAVNGLSETRVLLGVNGWRSYFFYVPLAFLVGAQFRAPDLARFAKITLMLAVPIAILVGLQFVSPMNASINVGIAEEKELQFKGIGLDAEHIRPTGPFTSTVGLQQFVVTASAFALACLILPVAARQVRLVPLLAAAAAVLTCVAFSGSRGTVLQCALMGLVALAVGVIGRGQDLKARALALPLTIGAAAVVMYPIVFPTSFGAFMARWEHAAAHEAGFEGGVLGRALFGLIDFVRLIEVAPALGYGLGYGSNASIQMRASVDGVMPGFLAETDFARHMVDLGPVFGLGYIVFRLVLMVWLLRLVLMATRRVSDPLPMMLFGYAGYILLLGQISGNGSINVYGWLFTGLCIAATHSALRTTTPRVDVAGRRALQRAPRWSRSPVLRARPLDG